MAAAKKVKTTTDRLRSVKRRNREEVRDLLDELREIYDSFSESTDIVDDLESLKVDVETLVEFLAKFDQDLADETETAAATWNLWIDGLEVPDVSGFVEAFGQLESDLDSFEDLVEQDNYPGIGDERAEAWAEVESDADLLADELDSLGIDVDAVEEVSR